MQLSFFWAMTLSSPGPATVVFFQSRYPWDYFESETGKAYRMQISTYGDMDSLELLTSICCEHLFLVQKCSHPLKGQPVAAPVRINAIMSELFGSLVS